MVNMSGPKVVDSAILHFCLWLWVLSRSCSPHWHFFLACQSSGHIITLILSTWAVPDWSRGTCMGLRLDFCHQVYMAMSSTREGAQILFIIKTIEHPYRLNYFLHISYTFTLNTRSTETQVRMFSENVLTLCTVVRHVTYLNLHAKLGYNRLTMEMESQKSKHSYRKYEVGKKHGYLHVCLLLGTS